MNVQIAQRLAELRRAKGYSQESLARELGLSRQAVSKWERAESSPDTENLIALARLYGVSLDELLSVDADIADDIAFENAERADKIAADDAARAADRETAAQAAAAAAQASRAAAQAAEAAARASSQATRVSESAAEAHRRGAWRSFPYATFTVILFFVFGFFFHAWATAWLIFLTVPIYRWVASILDGAAARARGERVADGGVATPTPPCVDDIDGADEEGR